MGDTTFDDDIEEKNPIIASDGDKGEGDTYDDDKQRSNVKNCPTIEILMRRDSLSAREEHQKRRNMPEPTLPNVILSLLRQFVFFVTGEHVFLQPK